MKTNRLLFTAVLALACAASFVAQAAGVDIAAYAAQHRDVLMGLALMGTINIPNGATVAIANAYGTAATVTALSNASSAVATVVNTFAIGDFVEVTSGWSKLNNKVVRLSAVSGTSATLEGIDTTSVTLYPLGGGIGSLRKVTGYTQLSQILGVNSSGGDQQYGNYQLLEDDSQREFPTVKAPARLALDIGDDTTLPGFLIATAANDDGLKRAIKITLKAGGIISHNALISLTKQPSLTPNEPMKVVATMALQSDPVRY
jgi:Phage tail tube protein, TTP